MIPPESSPLSNFRGALIKLFCLQQLAAKRPSGVRSPADLLRIIEGSYAGRVSIHQPGGDTCESLSWQNYSKSKRSTLVAYTAKGRLATASADRRSTVSHSKKRPSMRTIYLVKSPSNNICFDSNPELGLHFIESSVDVTFLNNVVFDGRLKILVNQRSTDPCIGMASI